MKFFPFLSVIALAVMGVSAWTLQGNVVDGSNGNVALSGADVSLLVQNKATTTNAQGQFSLTGTEIITSALARVKGLEVLGDGLGIQLTQSTDVHLTALNLLGSRIADFRQKLDAGNHSFRFSDLAPTMGQGISLWMIRIGQETQVLRVHQFQASTKVDLLVSGMGSSQVIDSLLVSKSGYETLRLPLTSLDANLSNLILLKLSSSSISSSSGLVSSSILSSSSGLLSSSSSGLLSSSGPLYGTMTDSRDGKTYKTVTIGTQVWMAENLNYGAFVSDGNFWSHLQNGAQKYCYDNTESYCATDGGIYQWHTAMGIASTYLFQSYTVPGANIQGICPRGWHLPKLAEWDTLVIALSGASVAGKKMKRNNIGYSFGYSTWDESTFNDGNSSGFSAVPAGSRVNSGFFFNRGGNAYFWEVEQHSSSNGWGRNLSSYGSDLFRFYGKKTDGFSVRCLKD
jgi:uncharacterized protein (TIGR02145 family)